MKRKKKEKLEDEGKRNWEAERGEGGGERERRK